MWSVIFLFVEIHFKGDKIDTWKFGYFSILCFNWETVKDRKNISTEMLLLLIRVVAW